MTPSQAKTTLGGFADDFSTLLTPFLTGVELFALSHVDRSFYRQLSGEDVWNDRIRPWSPRPPQSARAPVMPRCWQKHAYAKSRCVLSVPYDPSKGFDGKRVPRDLATWLSPQFDYTVDVFFCLLPQYLQDPLAKEVNLHVSLNHQVTVRVQPGRWYHLGWNLDEIETVYFNGTAIAQNARTDEHMFVWDGELRTNFFGLSQHPREATSKACFAMHGLVHTMRYWSSCFHSHIERLAQLEDLGINPLSKIQVTYDALGRPDQGEFSSQPHEKTGVLSTLSKFYSPRPAPLVPRGATNTSTMPPPTQITSTATGFQMEWVLTMDDLARLGLLPLLQGQGDQANQPPQQQQAPPAQQPGQPTQLAGFTDGLMVLLRPFLVGVDLLTLSHVSYRFYRQLSWDDTWRPRAMWWSPPKQLPVQQPPMLRCWEKQSYAQSRCLLSMPYEPTSNFAFDQARVGMDYTCTFQTQFNYTVDCWFCLLPQYVKRNEDGNVPEYVELYCSINQRTRLRLQPGRWYHIAWDLADVETVYLNGAPVTSSLRTSAHYFAWDGELRSNFFGAAPSSFPYDAKATFAMHGLFLTIRYWANVYNGLISGNAAMRDMGIKPTFQIQAEYDAQGRAKYGELCSQPHEMFGYLSTKSKYHPRNTTPLAQEPVVPVILPAQEPASVVVPLQTASAPATEPKTTQKADLSIHLKPKVAKNSSTKVINQPVYGFADGFVELLTPYLLGVDLLPLSYVSRAFHRQLSSASVWTPRIHDSSRPHPQQPANHHLTWCWQKQAYAETRSMLSKPWPMSALSLFSTNTAIVPSPYLVTSLDMWVCFLPQFLDKPEVTIPVYFSLSKDFVVDLKPGQWYHFAWSFDPDNLTVYQDGAWIGTIRTLGQNLAYCWDGELRTNFFGTQGPDRVYLSQQNSRFVIHGLIHKFREWNRRLSEEQAAQLAQGKPIDCQPTRTIQHKDFQQIKDRWVLASQPVEKYAAIAMTSKYFPRPPAPPKPVEPAVESKKPTATASRRTPTTQEPSRTQPPRGSATSRHHQGDTRASLQSNQDTHRAEAMRETSSMAKPRRKWWQLFDCRSADDVY